MKQIILTGILNTKVSEDSDGFNTIDTEGLLQGSNKGNKG